ncbi:MAG: hypothetical protein HYW25_01700 [Candidatus Aenigmarchaeota archaeon]|nr:hypothetical protein [Candidatus Aenigmarchaeota archaeon]
MKGRKGKKSGAALGIALTLVAAVLVLAASISFAHGSSENSSTMNHGMTGVQSGSMMQAHAMMGGHTSSMMNHMSMVQDHHDGTAEEGIENMIKHMDEDGDGECDFCKMSVDACKRMMSE